MELLKEQEQTRIFHMFHPSRDIEVANASLFVDEWQATDLSVQSSVFSLPKIRSLELTYDRKTAEVQAIQFFGKSIEEGYPIGRETLSLLLTERHLLLGSIETLAQKWVPFTERQPIGLSYIGPNEEDVISCFLCTGFNVYQRYGHYLIPYEQKGSIYLKGEDRETVEAREFRLNKELAERFTEGVGIFQEEHSCSMEDIQAAVANKEVLTHIPLLDSWVIDLGPSWQAGVYSLEITYQEIAGKKVMTQAKLDLS